MIYQSDMWRQGKTATRRGDDKLNYPISFIEWTKKKHWMYNIGSNYQTTHSVPSALWLSLSLFSLSFTSSFLESMFSVSLSTAAVPYNSFNVNHRLFFQKKQKKTKKYWCKSDFQDKKFKIKYNFSIKIKIKIKKNLFKIEQSSQTIFLLFMQNSLFNCFDQNSRLSAQSQCQSRVHTNQNSSRINAFFFEKKW